MNYPNYRQFRDELLQGRRPLRLECMNPVQALAGWVRTACSEVTQESCPDRAVAAWSRATGTPLDPERTVIGQGVRDLLSATFSYLGKRDRELWLPEDVYPVYWDLAARAGVSPRAFATLPEPDWKFLTRTNESAAVVIPIPLSPVGRLPTDSETDALSRWLRNSQDRLLVIDAVYAFDFSACRAVMDALLAEDQCIVLWSCSKSWLTPGSLGLAKAPSSAAPILRSHVALPSAADMSRITALLEGHPDLPRMQQNAFGLEWQRLAPRIRVTSPDWQPPVSGYFSVLSVAFERLLNEHGILAVPATVFGSSRNDLSVITCLHALAAHEEGIATL